MTGQLNISGSSGRWRTVLQLQDFAWALFVAVLLIAEPELNKNALILVPLIGTFQIIEPRFKLFRSKGWTDCFGWPQA